MNNTNDMKPKHIVCLEGCHATGKSSLLKLFSEQAVDTYDAIPENFVQLGALVPTDFITECCWISKWFKNVEHMLTMGQAPVILVDRSPFSALMYCSESARQLLRAIIDAAFAELRAAHTFLFHIVHVRVSEDELLSRVEKRLKTQPWRAAMSEGDKEHTKRILKKYELEFVDNCNINGDVIEIHNNDLTECHSQITRTINKYLINELLDEKYA